MRSQAFILNKIDYMGRWFVNSVEYTINLLLMTYLSVRTAVFEQAQGFRTVFSVVSQQIYFTGWQALPLISALAVAAGSIVIMQSSFQLNFLGGQGQIGKLLIVIIVREIGPLLTALIVIARSGTAVASELGNMKVNNEIEALRSLGINPLSYIVFPRLMGGLLSVLCLSFYFVVIALMGGFFVTKLIHDMPINFFIVNIANAVEANDVVLFLVKNTFSGVIIFAVSCYQGLKVEHSPNEVPVATTKAVVNSIIYVVGFFVIATAIFYINELTRFGVI